MRVATASPPTWPQPLAHPGPALAYPLRPVRLGQVVEVAGAAVSAARTGQGFASGSLSFDSTGQSLSAAGSLVGTATAIASVAPVLVGMAAIPVVGWIGAAVGALLMIAGGLFGGKPKLTHAQREALEVQKIGGAVGVMIGEIQATRSLDELWTTLLKWQSGYVGGTSGVAVSINFPDNDNPKLVAGDVILPAGFQTLEQYQAARGYPVGSNFPVFPIGKPNSMYPVLTKEAFFKYIEAGVVFRGNTQGGVTPSMLDPMNRAITNSILNQLARFRASGVAMPGGPDPAVVSTWVGQAYQQLLGRAPSSTERSSAVAALTAQQVTPQQFLSALMGTAEFVAAHGTAAAVTPGGAVLTGGAATTTGQPLSTYWWQQALLRPTDIIAPGPSVPRLVPGGASPVLMASVVPSNGGAAWLLGVGALGALGLLVATAPPRSRRRR